MRATRWCGLLLAGIVLFAGRAYAEDAEFARLVKAIESRYHVQVDYIMGQLAQNQDRALQLRTAFVYRQNLFIRFQRFDGKTCREEMREYTVTPSAKGTEKKLTRLSGKYLKDGILSEYSDPGYRYKEIDIDGVLIDDFAEDFANDKDSRDGISADMEGNSK